MAGGERFYIRKTIRHLTANRIVIIKLHPFRHPLLDLRHYRLESIQGLRGLEVADKVSPVATLGFVRRALVAKQQEMGKAKGIVMDGRDIGTVVFPDAELKLFVTASPEVRAKRRVDELEAKGIPASYEEVLENVKKRDYIDSTREESPLRQADDALVLDNSHMTLDEQKAWLLEQYHKAIGS